MAEITTTPRLMAAAKEFNIGKDTLVDFLVSKGFDKDELKPTAKLSEDMYRALQNEFQSDKVAKMKAVQIDLPKGAAGEAKKKRDEEEIHFRKEEKKPAKKEEPATPPVEEVPLPAPVEEKAPEPEPEPVAPPAPEVKPEETKAGPEVIRADAPEIEGPKIINKIDLSAIDSSTRPKKSIKKAKDTPPVKEETPQEVPTEDIKPVEELPAPVVEAVAEMPVAEEPEAAQAKEEEPVIENIKAEKLEGPKILGKIELPVDSDTRPKQDEKRKRKRIPIEKKEVRPSGQSTG
ncbi:MAG TPA: translation initiation factor IF-2, partial [Chitinophagaceae bacterium]|nr:translation initiation factor IF-2 [Chitinophagaceae bacterium]